MTAADIAKACGSATRSGDWWRCICPVHHSHGPTLALRDGAYGLITVCHAGCSRAEIMAELARRGLVSTRSRASAERRTARPQRDAVPTRETFTDDQKIARARWIWRAAQEPRGTPVAAYLAARGITIEPPVTLRWAPSLPRLDGGSGPAMVGIVEHAERGIIGLHRTWIGLDAAGGWRRLDRASLGPIRGGAVRLAPAADTLLVGEGIETCMAGMVTGMPAWAALSTSGLMALVLPPEVRHIIIAADNDASGAGQRAAQKAAQRWLAEGRRVRIAMPPTPGTDMADVLLGDRQAMEVLDVAA